jgi:hypothetical protein
MKWQQHINCWRGKHKEILCVTPPKVSIHLFNVTISYSAYMGCEHCKFTRPLTEMEEEQFRQTITTSFDDIIKRRLHETDT